MVTHPTFGLSLCAGVAGFDLALSRAFRGYQSVCYVEREISSAAQLVAEMEKGRLPDAPIWDSLETFDGEPWRGIVDTVIAGFSCQPWSVAGKRRGVDDERWIWPAIAEIIRTVAPRWVILENVPGLVRHGLGLVVNDLAAFGFSIEWDVFSASEVGAPHKRDRIFIMADADSGRCGQRDPSNGLRRVTHPDGAELANGNRQHSDGSGPSGEERRSEDSDRRGLLGHAAGIGRREGRTEPAVDGWRGAAACTERSAFPPGPSDTAGWREWIAAGGPAPAQSRVRVPSDGLSTDLGISRSDRLRAFGNAICPQQAELAIRTLMARLQNS